MSAIRRGIYWSFRDGTGEPMDNDILKRIREELRAKADPKHKEGAERYFKEKTLFYGVRNPIVNKMASEYWKEVKPLGKERIFELCEELLSSEYSEEAFIVCNWVPRMKRQFSKEDLPRFKRWVDDHLNTWAKVDSFCNHTMGDFIVMYPETVQELKGWTSSDNRWMRRASAVSLILPARRGEYLDDIFEIADSLLEDQDDMVQKGYGWMLKEASRKHQGEVLEYVLKNKERMPRTALRYAIELMPEDLRKEAMRK
jgi:3-methyladenine DNA glycosylase AlkD